MTNFDQLKVLLESPKNIVILPHKNPDGDAIGSNLGLSLFLQKLGHTCEIVSPNDFPKFLKWMPKAKEITIAEYNPKKAEILIAKAELIFILDFNTLSRIEELGFWVKKSNAPKALIDHHQAPDQFDFMYSDTSMPATCQMVYHFIEALEKTDLVDEEIASCLYSGIMTDTGNFRFRNTSSTTHRVVANLIDAGVKVDIVSSNILDSQSESRLKLLGITLQHFNYLPEFMTAFMYLTREEQLKSGFQKGDTEGFVNYGLSLEGSVFSAIFIEDTQNNFIKISFRSKGDFDVNQFSRNHFNGGGHINAAGGRSDLNMEQTIEKFVNLLNEYKEKLNHTQF